MRNRINLDLVLKFAVISKPTKEANYGTNPVARKIDNAENAVFQITVTKLYVPVVICQTKMTKNSENN